MSDKLVFDTSVVIPIYNGEKYIERTLECIRNQTLWPAEVVLVDDGSKDNTVSVVEKYLNEHTTTFPKAKFIKQSNQGAGGARNTGIKKSESEWISFLDSDDLWNQKKIELVAETSELHPEAKMITHNMCVFHQDTGLREASTDFNSRYDSSRSLFVQLYWGGFLPTASVTVKRKLLLDSGLFDVRLRSAQDYEMWLKCSLRMDEPGSLYIIDEPLVDYMITEGSISYNYKRKYNCGVYIKLKYEDEVRKILGRESNGFVKKSLYRFLAGEFRDCLRKKNVKGACWLALMTIKDTIMNNYKPERIDRLKLV